MYTIRQITETVAKLDAVPEEDRKSLDTSFRHLTQRFPFVPSSRDGRADLFDLPTVCAIRIVQVANDLGMSRTDCHFLTQFLLYSDPFAKPKGGMGLSVIAEIARLSKLGQEVSIFVDRQRNGQTKCRHNGHKPSPRAEAAFASAGISLDWAVSTEIKASPLVAEILATLEAQ